MQFNEMIAARQNKCDICGSELSGFREPCIDHDHATGKVRGMLCRGCNVGIGNLKDDPKILRAALRYLDARR
jgi:hypothetical protein